MTDWLDENCGANGWAMTPSGTHGVRNDAVSIYFGDATLASAFVAGWCAGYGVETAGGETLNARSGNGVGGNACSNHPNGARGCAGIEDGARRRGSGARHPAGAG
jgi:hypothetical protein